MLFVWEWWKGKELFLLSVNTGGNFVVNEWMAEVKAPYMDYSLEEFRYEKGDDDIGK